MLQLILFFISIYISYKFYKFLKCPPELVNVPSLGLLAILKIGTSNESFDDMIENYCFGPNGWGVIVADPQVAKVVLNNSDVFQKNVNSTLNSNPYGLKFMGREQITNLNGEVLH
ncbi:hypothetical protein CONCODRAFT_69691 [Conidiobolus coronatus NRRL 28638]|uniref:Uncharacterized protein n=1 Tax=Conidiobolus coronatus (strain ATCC 28846 / CBS 209.66 / NRRL 28638) TaxID=796925 RepID=A0A137P9A9_CONC2|nr:hypothetical protein CONCODRAFT_69691 [Conidiobolus coronatus NRRL 28638]|eukprot:KXN71597.1 hypothetical protein CONCODRAFT_69691 [Conidiobolus coronatus NRRL 28638]